MSYFPTDIPFMSDDELKNNGIKIIKDDLRRRWISVTEGLPEEEGAYIVTIQCEHVDGWDDYVTGVAEYDKHGWYIVSFYPGQIKVVAWMEFPSAYKGEKNDNS